MHHGWIKAAGACLATLIVIAGCRGTRLPVLDRTPVGIVYDTAQEAHLRSGKALPLLEQAWAEYVDTLAEPAAIVGWRDGVSTWEIFFATNREQNYPDPGQRATFGNRPVREPVYGRAEVTLPRRGRGIDPATKPRSKLLLTSSSTSRAADDDVVQFDSVSLRDAQGYLEGLNGQLSRTRQKDLLIFVHGSMSTLIPRLFGPPRSPWMCRSMARWSPTAGPVREASGTIAPMSRSTRSQWRPLPSF